MNVYSDRVQPGRQLPPTWTATNKQYPAAARELRSIDGHSRKWPSKRPSQKETLEARRSCLLMTRTMVFDLCSGKLASDYNAKKMVKGMAQLDHHWYFNRQKRQKLLISSREVSRKAQCFNTIVLKHPGSFLQKFYMNVCSSIYWPSISYQGQEKRYLFVSRYSWLVS